MNIASLKVTVSNSILGAILLSNVVACTSKQIALNNEPVRTVASGGGQVDSSGQGRTMKYLFWVPYQQQGEVAIATREESHCDGKIFLVKSRTAEVLAEATETDFTTTPMGEAVCGDNSYIDQHVSFQTYDIPSANNEKQFGRGRQLIMLINENSNYHDGHVTMGDLFLVDYSLGPDPQVIAKCKNCAQQIENELTRVLTKKQYSFYQEFHPEQSFSRKIEKLTYAANGDDFSVNINANLGGHGCWWASGVMSIRSQLQIIKSGQDLIVKVQKPKLSGSSKSCLGPKS